MKDILIDLRLLIMLTCFFLISGCASVPPHIENKIFYTQVNMWHTDESPIILSTNYHSGKIIPAGTEVNITSYGDEIEFITVKENKKYVLVHVRKHTDIPLEELFNRYFSSATSTDRAKVLSSFSEEEKKMIAQGVISEGMSREAALVAYGYPPSHKTPSVELNRWIYWLDRRAQISVVFRGDRIARIETPTSRSKAAKQENLHQPSTMKFSLFGNVELAPVKLDTKYAEFPINQEAASQIEKHLFEGLTELFPAIKKEANTKPSRGTNSGLRIEPLITEIRYVSTSARFWGGGAAGNTYVRMVVKYLNSENGSIIASPSFYARAGKRAGAWSVGASDRKMLERIATDIKNYTVKNL